MAVWLHGGALLLLLAFSSAGVHAAAQQRLCGADLVDALHLNCGRGKFFYKREVDPLLGFFPPNSGQDGEIPFEYPSKKRAEMRRKGDIVEQCCFKSCSIFDLMNYCN